MEQCIKKLQEPEFWAQAWKESRSSSDYVKMRIRDEEETIEFWNKFAPRYEKRNSPDSGNDRVQKVIDFLDQEGTLTGETNILDVGSGPGTYALPFAPKCSGVTALDGALEMCRELEKKVAEQQISNINVLHRMWEDVDIDKEGLSKSFDLVFASLSPAIFDLETLDKMNRASRKHCCLISWASEAHNKARRDLWEILFKKKYTGNGQNIIYPFNLLFSMGHFPTIRYFDSDHNYSDPVDEAIERLCSTFWLFMEITPEVRDTIASYVRERSVNNIFHQETLVRLGMITWQVQVE